MDKWIAVFSAGTHTDSAGKSRTWTEADLDGIVASYDPNVHEAPIVIGHPRDNSPAWGWVEGLRREGGVLYARLGRLVPEFVQMIKKGMFKKRSVSLYADGRLRHLGFLGAKAPAVKGLPDISFHEVDGEGAAATYEDPINEVKEVHEVSFLERLKGGRKKEGPKTDRAEARALAEKLLSEGRITPAAAGAGMGLVNFIEAVSAIEGGNGLNEGGIGPSEGGNGPNEGGKVRSQRPVEFLMEFLANLPVAVQYGEAAPASSDIQDPGAQREHLVSEYMEKNPGASLRDAVLAVSGEHPELFER